MEHPKRTLIKTITWRFFGMLGTIVLVYFYSRNIKESLAVGIIVDGFKMLLYYIHERIWNRLKFGRVLPPDYQI